MEEEGLSGKVSLSKKVVLVLLAIEAGAVKEGLSVPHGQIGLDLLYA